MGVDWILPPFSFTASFTHTQTELQCYSERVSCLNPRTESEKERTREKRGEGGSKRNKREVYRMPTIRSLSCTRRPSFYSFTSSPFLTDLQS